jgi:hypothetical protein
MPVSINNTQVVFNDATTQTTAPVNTSANVNSVSAGTGISVSATTGALTVTNAGVTSVAAGTGISVSASTGGVTITNTGPTTTSQIQTQLFTTSGSWTAPTGVTKVKAICAGGGGGGNFGYEVEGGNGGVSYALVTVVPGTSYTITIGNGGSGGTNSGSSGGSSSFASFISANGGGGSTTSSNPGTGTVSSGTIIKTGNVNLGTNGGFYPFIGTKGSTGGVVAYSASGSLAAGGGGGFTPTNGPGGGGTGGAIFLEWVGA